MPKDRIEAAIKRASGRDAANYQQVLYEGYAPHGVALLVETATDNPVRTVAQVRSIMTKHGGNLATNGSVSFMFNKMGVFRLDPAGIDQDDLELYLIDHGLEEMGEGTGEKGEPQIVIRCAFADFGKLQEALEARKLAPLSAEHEYLCTVPTTLPEAQATEVLELIDKLEQDDDVQTVVPHPAGASYWNETRQRLEEAQRTRQGPSPARTESPRSHRPGARRELTRPPFWRACHQLYDEIQQREYRRRNTGIGRISRGQLRLVGKYTMNANITASTAPDAPSDAYCGLFRCLIHVPSSLSARLTR